MVLNRRVNDEHKHLASALVTLALFCISIVGVFVPGHIALATESMTALAEDVSEGSVRDRFMKASHLSVGAIRAPEIMMEIPEVAIDFMIWPIDGAWNNSCGFRCGCPTHGGGHLGKDMGTFSGTPSIIAAASGRVIDVVQGFNSGNGNVVEIDHGFGIVSSYAHLSHIAVIIGQLVEAGEHIGNAGSTGASAGNHLHFEVTVDGVHVDPMSYLSIPVP